MLWWKIYFWVYLIFGVFSLPVYLNYSPLGLFEIIGLLSGIVLLLAIYAYVFKKKVLETSHWRIILWIVVFLFVEEMIELFVLPKDFMANFIPILTSKIPVSAGDRLFSWLLS